MVATVLDYNLKEVKKISNPGVDWVLEHLQTHVCQVFFRKKLNGKYRSIKCTREFSKLPVRYKSLSADEILNPHGILDLIPVWEIVTKDWKSFYYDSIIYFNVYLKKGEKYAG